MARILLVDDSMFTRKLACRVLRTAGHDVQEASAAAEALTLLRGTPPDCVVTDFYMPGLCGLEFLQRLRQELPHTPIILLSAEAESIQPEALGGLRISACLSKPMQPQPLIRAIEDVLEPLGT